jgi:pyruvate ferredoxin oxidoreductase alpha subunit
VLAPGTVAEAYDQSRLAFQLAYGYNIPVILLYDQKLGGEMMNVPANHFDREPNPDLGAVTTEAELEDAPHGPGGKFHRYRYDAEDGVSPRSIPGQKGGHFLVTGNEHNPAGHIDEDPTNRVTQVERRMSKLDGVREFLDDKNTQTYMGPAEADYGLVTFGSQQGTVREAVDRLNEAGHSVKGIGVSDMMPYPVEEMTAFLESVDEALVVEMNASGQFRGLTQKELGRFGDTLSSLLKYNGEPFEPSEIISGFEASIEGQDVPEQQTTYVPAAGD